MASIQSADRFVRLLLGSSRHGAREEARRRKPTVSAEAHQQLEAVLNTTPHVRVRARGQALLRAHRGRRPRHLADALGVRVRTMPRWLQAAPHPRGAGLKLQGGPGRPRRLPEARPATLWIGLPQGPAGWGGDRAHGTSAALATSLDQTPGLAVSPLVRRLAIATPIRSSRTRPSRLGRGEKNSRRGGPRPAESRCSARLADADPADHAGAPRASPAGGPPRWPRPALSRRGPHLGDWAPDHPQRGAGKGPAPRGADSRGAAPRASGVGPPQARSRSGLAPGPPLE